MSSVPGTSCSPGSDTLCKNGVKQVCSCSDRLLSNCTWVDYPCSPTVNPTSSTVKTCAQIGNASGGVECAYTPYCLFQNNTCIPNPRVTAPIVNGNCTSKSGSRCNVQTGNAETCNEINGSLYWQSTACAYGCYGGKCNQLQLLYLRHGLKSAKKL